MRYLVRLPFLYYVRLQNDSPQPKVPDTHTNRNNRNLIRIFDVFYDVFSIKSFFKNLFTSIRFLQLCVVSLVIVRIKIFMSK